VDAVPSTVGQAVSPATTSVADKTVTACTHEQHRCRLATHAELIGELPCSHRAAPF
jgi:hypothetical protein